MTRQVSESWRKIWAAVERIPVGCVATYGQVAAEAGLARRARLVGYALRGLPAGTDVPWHRVINAQGRISFPEGSEAWLRQRERLESEGIVFRGGRIDLERFRWRPHELEPGDLLVP